MNKEKISIFWFRRDLRLNDNRGLSEALNGLFPVLPIFIYDSEILDELESDDPRFTFIHDQISGINEQLVNYGTSIYTLRGKPMDCWNGLLQDYDIQEVYTNEDYEPYARQRDKTVEQLLEQKDVPFRSFKDQVIFAKNDVLKGDNTPYSIYTPFKNKWIAKLDADDSVLNEVSNTVSNFAQISSTLMTMDELGFIRSKIEVPDFKIDNLDHYEDTRNFPALNTTSYLSTHLRFGTVSIRSLVRRLRDNKVFQPLD